MKKKDVNEKQKERCAHFSMAGYALHTMCMSVARHTKMCTSFFSFIPQ